MLDDRPYTSSHELWPMADCYCERSELSGLFNGTDFLYIDIYIYIYIYRYIYFRPAVHVRRAVNVLNVSTCI